MDLYRNLGVEKTATPQEIKKAYHKLSQTHHPDKGGQKEVFQQIVLAYEVLSNSDKRKKYDNGEPIFDQLQKEVVIQQRVIMLFEQFVEAAPVNMDTTNIFSYLTKQLQDSIDQGLPKAIAQCRKKIKKFNNIKRRIGKTKGQVFINVLERKIKHNENQIIGLEKEAEDIKLMIEYLNKGEFEYEVDPVTRIYNSHNVTFATPSGTTTW